MRTRPPDVSEAEIGAALRDGWAIDAESLAYLPVGFGAHHWDVVDSRGSRHFVTVDELDRKPWLGDETDLVFPLLSNCYRSARLLQAAGLEFVAAPCAGAAGDTARRLGPRYSVCVQPFIDGQAAEFGASLNRDTAELLVGPIARLHARAADVAGVCPDRPLAVPGRARLEAALADLGRPWSAGPYSEPAHEWLRGRAAEVRAALERFDELARLVATGSAKTVTHGEPHAGNAILTAEGGLRLVDWDTVAFAERERDLWLISDSSPGVLRRYHELTGYAPREEALDLYRLEWRLADTAAFISVFRSAHAATADADKTWRGLMLSWPA